MFFGAEFARVYLKAGAQDSSSPCGDGSATRDRPSVGLLAKLVSVRLIAIGWMFGRNRLLVS
jgi:hypothetical protein